MNRAARLQSAKHWLPTYTGRDRVRGYRNWYAGEKWMVFERQVLESLEFTPHQAPPSIGGTQIFE
jgi:hypothetical protein